MRSQKVPQKVPGTHLASHSMAAARRGRLFLGATMSRSRGLLAAVLVVVWGCGPPELDTSSASALVESLARLEDSIEPDRREAFRDAIAYLTDDATVGIDVGPVEPFLEVFVPFEGLTAEEILTAAWVRRVDNLRECIADLDARRRTGAAARSLIERVELSDVRLFPISEGNLERPLVEAVVHNGTRSTLFGISFQASLRPAHEESPWVIEVVDRPIGSGLAPGQRSSIRFGLDDSRWNRALEARPDAVFLCGVVRLLGSRGRVLAATEYGPTDAYLHQLWTQQLRQLLSAPPGGVSVS
jgi:hypothetical protein